MPRRNLDTETALFAKMLSGLGYDVKIQKPPQGARHYLKIKVTPATVYDAASQLAQMMDELNVTGSFNLLVNPKPLTIKESDHHAVDGECDLAHA